MICLFFCFDDCFEFENVECEVIDFEECGFCYEVFEIEFVVYVF